MDLICITRHEPQRRGLTRYGEEGQKQEKQSGDVQDREWSLGAPAQNKFKCDIMILPLLNRN